MVTISRNWATPLTIGAFSLMSVTGLLMFFHAETGMNKLAHEWVGLVMVAGVAAHAAANWAGFKRYFLSGYLGRGLIALGLLALAASFLPPLGGKRLSPPAMAMKAVVSAPLARIAPLAGRSTEQAIADLARAGVRIANGEVSIEKATAGDRELQGKAISALFAKAR